MVETEYPTVWVRKVAADQDGLPGGLARLRASKYATAAERDAAVQAHLREQQREKDAEVDARAGLRSVIDAISASRRPVVGHNCLLDLAHTHEKFIGPLPATAAGFGASLLAAFGAVADTKHVLNSSEALQLAVPSTWLGDAYAKVTSDAAQFKDCAEVVFADGMDRYKVRAGVSVCGGGESALTRARVHARRTRRWRTRRRTTRT